MNFQDAIKYIKDSVNIQEVISEFVNLKKRGINYTGLCPFHNDRHSSFSVSPTKQIYKCFACGKTGDVYQFLIDHENMTFPEAVQWCAKRLGITIENDNESTPEQLQARKYKESLQVVMQASCNFFQNNLQHAASYLQDRGYYVDDDILKIYKVGYAPLGNLLFKDLSRNGYNQDLMQEVNLTAVGQYGPYDIFQGRLMFPFLDNQGNVVGYTGRILQSRDGVAKYSNTKDTPLFNKGSYLFGLFQARQSIGQMGYAYLVEGQFDVMSLAAVGVTNAVASSGTALTEAQVKLLSRYTREVVLNYDGDAAGQKACRKTAAMMLKFGLEVKSIMLPQGKDPDDIAKEKGSETAMFLKNNTKDIVSYLCLQISKEELNDPAVKEQHLNDLCDIVSNCGSATLRHSYAQIISKRLSIPSDMVLSRIKSFLAKKPEQTAQDDLKPGLYGLDVLPQGETGSVHITCDWNEFLEGYGEDMRLYIHEKLSMQDIQEIRRKCTLLDVDYSDLSIQKDGRESILLSAMAECFKNGITEISVNYTADNQSMDSIPDESDNEDNYINREYRDEVWTFINTYVYKYHLFLRDVNPYDHTPYIQRCAELIACADDSVRIINYSKYQGWLSLTKQQLNEILKPFLAKRKSRMAINAQRDDDDIYYDPDQLPDYVENEPKYQQMYQQCKFYPKLNHDGIPVCYIFKNGNDKGHTMVGDFFMEPLLHIQSDIDEDNKRVVKINRRYYKQPIYLEVQSKAFLKKSTIEERLIMLEAVNFTDGEEKHWTKIREWMSRNFVTCKEIKIYGNQQTDGFSKKEDNMFFAFANGIYHQVDGEWRFDAVNELGVVTHNKKNYYLPAFSTIYAGSDNQDKYELVSTLYYKELPPEQQCSFEKWADLMNRVYRMNNNGKWAILYAVMCAFRINIHCQDRLFTAPFFMGPMSSGKTQIAISIRSLFISPKVPIFNLNIGTDAAMSTLMSTFRDVPVVLDEYNNKDISDVKFQALKGIVYDGDGKQKRRGTSGKEIENEKVYTPVVICGQETPQRDDNALMSRIIVCEVPKPAKARTQEELDLFAELKDIEERGLSNVLLEILKLRSTVMDRFRLLKQECYKELKSRMSSTGEVDRLMKTASLFLATCKLLTEYSDLKLPFTYEEFFEIAFAKINFQIELISKTDKLATFFKAMDVMIDTKAIIEGRDYDIVEQAKVTIKSPGGERSEVQLPAGTKVLYLRMGAIYTQYARSSYNKEESTQSTIEQNLRSNPAYIGLVNSRRFKWYTTIEVPRGGLEEDTSGTGVQVDNTMVKKVERQEAISSCIAINYDMFRQIYDIDLQRKPEESEDSKHESNKEDLPF
jgi:DNA primase catalytic core|nr:MAG TPA: DNA directed DNA polymerase [Caudoviricetes sp.]